jgi:hypothetical protein
MVLDVFPSAVGVAGASRDWPRGWRIGRFESGRCLAESVGMIGDLTAAHPGARGETFLFARFRAPDYSRMRQAFESLQQLLQRHGARGHRIYRLADDPHDYVLIVEFASGGGARGFMREPQLACAIDAAGVEGGAHHIRYVEELRDQLEVVEYPQ